MWMDFQSNNNEINSTLTPSSQSRSELIHGELQQNLPSKHSTFQQQQNKSFYADPINYRAHPNPQQPLPSLPQQHFQMQTHSETQTHTLRTEQGLSRLIRSLPVRSIISADRSLTFRQKTPFLPFLSSFLSK